MHPEFTSQGSGQYIKFVRAPCHQHKIMFVFCEYPGQCFADTGGCAGD